MVEAMRRSSIVWMLVLLAFGPLAAAAQDASDLMSQGIAAFREGRHEDAARLFERATEQDPQNAEAFFLLARVYGETPLLNRKKADEALDRALALDPNNLSYLVGRLQLLRADANNFFTERMRETRRLELARKILSIDSTNAFAHEELGRMYIHDFWRYRNAIMLPTLAYTNRAASTGLANMASISSEQALIEQADSDNPLLDPSLYGGSAADAVFLDPNAVFQADQFDLELLEQRGVPVLDLSRRAQRAYERAIGHLKASLQTDPRRRSVYDDLMEIYALKGEFEEAAGMLQEMHTFFPEDDKTWLYQGLAQYRLGDMDAAYKSFESAFGFMDEAERTAFSSLDYLLPADEERRYREDPEAYASRFWTSKDPRYLTPYNERKLEHFARLTYADLLYGSEDLDLRGWDTQRGRILVRYGVPRTDVVIMANNRSQSAERLLRDGSPIEGLSNQQRMLRGDGPVAGSQSLSSRGEAFDLGAQANVFNVWDYGEFRFVFEDPFRNGEFRLYSPSAAEVSQGAHPWINDYVIRAEETFRKVPERYEYEAPGRQIQLPYLVTAFKGEEGKADVYVHYGVPITQKPEPGQERYNITANVGAFLISSDRDILVEERRTIYGLEASRVVPFKETQLWVDSRYMSAPPGTHEVSMEFETASGGTVAVQRREIAVPDYANGRLALSDVMLAYHVEESPDGKPVRDADIVRRGLSISPAPWSVYSVEQPIYLYFEAYNLRLNAQGQTDYEVEALLTPKDKSRGVARVFKNLFGGDKGVSVRLPGSGNTPDDGQYLILDATNQPAGLYTLVLRLHDNVSGRTVDRELDLFLE